jgi:hypothetical protein
LETSFLNKLSGFTETEKIAFRKKILLFGFFLTISIILWLLIALSKPYNDQINYPVSYKNFPESKVLIGDLPDYLTLNVNADGFTLLRYKLSSRYIPISFSVNSFKMNHLPGADSSSFYIETRLAREHIASQLSSEFTIIKISPDTLVFRFSGVASKKVPVIPVFTYQLDKQLILKNQLNLNPDSVFASGPDYIIDTLKAVYTQTSNMGTISRSEKENVDLQTIKFVYIKESEVNVGFEIEQFTEKTLQVPVEIINMPRTMRLQAFPRYIQLTCQVGLSNYEKLEGSMFRAQVDYLEIISDDVNNLKVSITKQPVFIQALRFSPKTVEFIIEK